MPEPLPQKLTKLIKQALTDGKSVLLPGLGTLRINHHPAKEVRSENGEIKMLPPRDTIEFDEVRK